MIYRKDIQGLRAISVCAVIFYHAGFSILSGGFLGVDIFFVISGYLITLKLISQNNFSKKNILNFYVNRIRRIIPSLLFTIFFSAILVLLVLPPKAFYEFSQSIISTLTMTSNILFWRQNGYFDSDARLRPLIHTWSLSIEEQFYLIFPIFFLLIYKLFNGKIINYILFIVGLISFTLCVWASFKNPSINFFLLPTRVWEFILGSLIALNQEKIKIISKQIYFDLIGIIFIFYSLIYFDEKINHPGLYTIFPVLGASMLLINSGTGSIIRNMLSLNFMVLIGVMSYSLYLLHQPIFVFLEHISGNHPSNTTFFLAIIVVFILSYFSFKYIEAPCRDISRIKNKPFLICIALASVILIVFSLLSIYNNGFESRFLMPSKIKESLLGNSIRNKCDQNRSLLSSDIDICKIYDNEDSTQGEAIAIFGDSHSVSLLPAFIGLASHSEINSIYHFGLPGCPPFMYSDVLNGIYSWGICKAMAVKAYEFVKEKNIKNVFFVGRWSLYNSNLSGSGTYFLGEKESDKMNIENTRMIFNKSLRRTVEDYKKIGIKVSIINQIPQQSKNIENLYYQKYSPINSILGIIQPEEFGVNLDDHLKINGISMGIFSNLLANNMIDLYDLSKSYCNDINCPVGDIGGSYYSDQNHLSNYGAKKAVHQLKLQYALYKGRL